MKVSDAIHDLVYSDMDISPVTLTFSVKDMPLNEEAVFPVSKIVYYKYAEDSVPVQMLYFVTIDKTSSDSIDVKCELITDPNVLPKSGKLYWAHSWLYMATQETIVESGVIKGLNLTRASTDTPMGQQINKDPMITHDMRVRS